jgi:hypothetical protein
VIKLFNIDNFDEKKYLIPEILSKQDPIFYGPIYRFHYVPITEDMHKDICRVFQQFLEKCCDSFFAISKAMDIDASTLQHIRGGTRKSKFIHQENLIKIRRFVLKYFVKEIADFKNWKALFPPKLLFEALEKINERNKQRIEEKIESANQLYKMRIDFLCS